MKTEDIKLFQQIAETGSLVQTADLLNLPKSNLSRRLQALERELGVQLFHRDNRRLSLTVKGDEFYRNTRSLVVELDNAVEDLRSQSKDLRGSLRVQLLPLPQLLEIVSIIFDFMSQHPHVQIEIITSSDEKNLSSDQIDVGFRIGHQLDDEDFVAREIRSEGMACFASPNYLSKHGIPASLDELSNHECVQMRFPNGRIYNRWPIGDDFVVNTSGKLIINSIQLLIEAVCRDRGIGYLPERMAQPLIDDGAAVRLFPEIPSAPHHGWLIHRKSSELTPTVRKFVDYLIEKIADSDI